MANETHESVLRYAREVADGILMVLLLAEHFKQSPSAELEAEKFLILAEGLGDDVTFPELGAEWSDLAAQEFRDSLTRKIHRAKAIATGKPFDPTAFQKRHPDEA